MVCLNENLIAVPVLAEPETLQCKSIGQGEARESTKDHAFGQESRGGSQELPKRKRGRPRKPESELSQTPEAIRMRKVYAKRREGRSKIHRKWVIQRAAGHTDRAYELLSDIEVDVAIKRFWDKRGMRAPTASSCEITPSVSDFEDEIFCFNGHKKPGFASLHS